MSFRYRLVLVLLVALTVASLASAQVSTSKIAFSALRGNYPPVEYTEIWIMDPDGSNQVQLTDNQAFDFSPDWSPDGKKIAFSRMNQHGCGNNCDFNYEIFYMRADGTDEVQVTSNATGDPWVDPPKDQSPDWSPQGTAIAFHSDRDNDTFNVFIKRICGDLDDDGLDDCWNTTPVQLTTDGGTNPAWGPNNLIAYRKNGNIHLVRTNGTGDTQLTDNPDPFVRDGSPAWGPSGKYLLYVKTTGQHVFHSDIWRMKADGTQHEQLTNVPGQDTTPTWSPDGNQIFFASTRGPCCNQELYLMDRDGSNQQDITMTPLGSIDPAREGEPDWSGRMRLLQVSNP